MFELNTRLLTNPALLTQQPTSAGYLAVVQPKHTEASTALRRLITEAQYHEHVPGAPVPARGPSTAPPLPDDDDIGGGAE